MPSCWTLLYRLCGGTADRGDFDDRYGLAGGYVTWQDRHAGIKRGISESLRVLRVGGILLVKCQDQVCSGAVRWQTREFADHAEAQGARLVDMLHYLVARHVLSPMDGARFTPAVTTPTSSCSRSSSDGVL